MESRVLREGKLRERNLGSQSQSTTGVFRMRFWTEAHIDMGTLLRKVCSSEDVISLNLYVLKKTGRAST